MTPTSKLLRAARAKIEREECWTKGVLARDAKDRPLFGLSSASAPTAVCWCAEGAIWAVVKGDYGLGSYLLSELTSALPRGTDQLSEYNDVATHADILDAYDRAIAAAESA
jgi:hypothetical protein